MNKKKHLPLATQIFIGLGLGVIAGLLFLFAGKADWAVSYIKPFGTIFLNLIKFIVVPIVLCSIISGVISMKDIRKVGSIGWKTIVYYMMTTACAVLIGLVFANLFKGKSKNYGSRSMINCCKFPQKATRHGGGRRKIPQFHQNRAAQAVNKQKQGKRPAFFA